MDVKPATVSVIREGEDGKMYELDSESGTVAADLQRIDKGLKVRFSCLRKGHEFFAVYHENHEGCAHNAKDATGKEHPVGHQYLVSTIQARQNSVGTWEGLDQRVVDRIMLIGHSSYDYGAELENQRRERERRERQEREERMGPVWEKAAHLLRKDLGATYKGRVFLPRGIAG